ncbi:MAG: carboxypeptidase-like regulatory domain-containing protein [Terracidiphilus sp.]
MSNNWCRMAALAGMLVPSLAFAQQSCRNGFRIEGTITDPTGAVIPGATVHASSGETATTTVSV